MSVVEESIKLTPMMEQWQRCKGASKGALLFFRMGDFYEAFYEDARVIAEEVELTLTQRGGIPMCGVPWHTCDTYIDRLVEKGYRVAVAEQTEDPKKAKGLVNREIVRFVTPGTVVNSGLLGDKSHNFIAAVTQVGAIFGLAVCDITTATFRVVEVESTHELVSELYRLAPSEIVASKKFQEKQHAVLREFEKVPLSTVEEWRFEHQTSYGYLSGHFQVPHLDGFGLRGMVAAINAAGALLAYIHEELSLSIAHVREIKPYSTRDALLLDKTCQLNLELTQPLQERGRTSTLLHVIDHTLTPMGGRQLREWLKKPLLDVKEITERHDSVEAFLADPDTCIRLQRELKEVRDLERLMMKTCAGFATPRDLATLGASLKKIGPIKALVREVSSALLFRCSEKLSELPALVERLQKALVDEPPVRISEGNIFREGFDAELDELRALMQGGKEWLARYQTTLKETTGIRNLKVSFNKIFGYYIEVSKGQAHQMPPSFERRQTLVNCERFISPDLKEYESKVLTAEERALGLEQELYLKLRGEAALHERSVFASARALAEIDALLSLAHAAHKYRYCRPVVDMSQRLSIIEGRHPVVEANGVRESFIPNDTTLDSNERMMLITGPNMAGKSTYIRQVALIVILAQMGSFVPSRAAHIGVIDRIFTRIGASDDLSRGQSTFMVEMSETANILNNITPRSLVILDEIGRGTSTYDGVSIAYSVAEYLLATPAKTLFATHYWELTELEKTIPGAVNYHASVQEWNDTIIFLHKIAKGGTDRSYGIHVARLAGLPLSVIQRATAILGRLESRKDQARKAKKDSSETQLTLF
ncbi:DNA mismatch repair protein MutS [Chlamydiota bacterium]